MTKFPTTIIVSFFLLFFILLLTRCEKEYSYEGGPVSTGGTAVYTLDKTGDSCTAYSISGSYLTGLALSASNTVQLEVTVTTIGTYTLSTSTVNGISFSGSGTFTSTGVQTIVLTGTGTPASSGTYSYNPLVATSCSFSISVIPLQASFTLSGAPNNCSSAVLTGNYIYGTPLGIGNTVTITVNVTSKGAYAIGTDTIDNIYFTSAGTFTSTGVQQVMLVGYGTPNLPNNLVFTVVGGGTICNFPLTVETPAPYATYVLESNFGGPPNPCNAPTIQGTYKANSPMSTSNTISLRVDATLIGNYAIATNTVNGVTFLGTGNIAAIGAQSVTLNATGTPLSSGNFTFTPQIVGPAPIGGSSCGFDIIFQ